eukprot:jgi/Galph1/3715/GphlegSOOS_G2358.1
MTGNGRLNMSLSDHLKEQLQESVRKAEEATKKFGKDSKEATAAWNAVEELNAEASHKPSQMSNDHSSWVNFDRLTMDSPLFYCQQFDLASPLVNRQQAVLQVLEAFSDSYDKSDPKKLRGVRPVVCFAGHMYGAGKTTFGVRFNEFLVINKEFISQARSKQRLPGCATPEESLDVLYNKTLFVYLSLKEFPQKGTDFAYSFAERICKAALSEFPNSQGLLSEVLPLIPQGPSEWLRKLMRVINKKYLYLFLDEIGYLGVKDYFQFSDLRSPSSNEDSSNVYPTFFRILSNLFPAVYVLCIVAGRSDAIVRRQEDAMPSRIDLRFLRLDPFSSDIVKDIVQQSRYGKETLREIIFPKTPQGIDWLSEIVWDYTGGVPIYVHYVLSELAKMFVSNPQWQDLSKEELRDMVETIEPRPALFVSPPNLGPKTVAVFSSMLLASVLEIPLRPEETYFRGMNLGLYSTYALDIANSFGFYYSYGENPNTFKLVYPKIVLKYLEKYCGDIPIAVSRGMIFETLIAMALYLRLCFCQTLGDISIFQKTLVEDCMIKNTYTNTMAEDTSLFFLLLLNMLVLLVLLYQRVGVVPDGHLTQMLGKSFFDAYLSQQDGIFIPSTQNSNGPDLMLRVSKQSASRTNIQVLTDDDTDSMEEVNISRNKSTTYLIGISLKCYGTTGRRVGLPLIKEETEKFLIPVAQHLDLASDDIFAIQLIISTNYTSQVSKQFRDNQNWVLDSGIYNENANKEISFRSFSSSPPDSATKEWLTIPNRCQLVVCSTSNLKAFLGSVAYDKLQDIFSKVASHQRDTQWEIGLLPLSSTLSVWSQTMFRDNYTENKSSTTEEERNVIATTDAMQVEYRRKAQSAAASSSMDSSFDLRSFLLRKVGLEENRVNEYISKLPPLPVSSLKYASFQDLIEIGLKEEDVVKIMFALRKVSTNH